MESSTALLSLSVACIIFCLYYRHRRSNLPLPPGPKKRPIIGNLLEMPTIAGWNQYHEWSKEHNSDIIHLDALGTSIVVLDTYEAAMDLFDKKGTIYSGRSRMVMATELMGWDWTLTLKGYGKEWRSHRRLLHNTLSEHSTKKFRPHSTRAAHKMLRIIMDRPDNFLDHIHHMAASVAISVAYGFDIQEENDPHVDLIEKALHGLALAMVPGAYLVDTIPALKYVPSWFPGAKFKRDAAKWKQLSLDSVSVPFKNAKAMIEDGTAKPSFTSICLSEIAEGEANPQQEEIISHVASAMYGAGTDTTTGAIQTFILAMLCHPHVQEKAQAEINRVINPGHLPTFDDTASLPYVTAVVCEVFRWNPLTPIGIPHLLDEEDTYRGFRIPRKSLVIGNMWAILHNEEMYPEPDKFNPDRFMDGNRFNEKVLDPRKVIFGFGRRICPGQYLGAESVWIGIASLLATYHVSKAVDQNGRFIEPVAEFDDTAIVRHPKPFKCTIKPKSEEAAALIAATENED